VELAAGRTFSDVFHGVFARSQTVIGHYGGTVARPWISNSAAGL
jgi:hypothetical protein